MPPQSKTESPISKTFFIKKFITRGELSKPTTGKGKRTLLQKKSRQSIIYPMITFDDFKKLDIRIGKILAAEKVEGTEKLLRLEIDFGLEKRQVVAGMAETYQFEQLIGREVPVLMNLEPRSIRGIESQGMILAADNSGKPVLLQPDGEVPPGSIVR